jgi:hypothetical protein
MNKYTANDLHLTGDKFKELVNLPVVKERYLSSFVHPRPENYADMIDMITLSGITFVKDTILEG